MPSQSPRQLPVPCQPALPRYPPAAACPASRPHLPLREVSGAPHLLSAFPVSSPSRCRCLETLAGLENFPSVPFRAAAPVNPRLSAHASFIMPGLPLQDPAHAPPLPPGLSGRGRTNPPRKGCDALRLGVALCVPPAPSGLFPEFPRPMPICCLSLPANSPEAHGDAACRAPPRAPGKKAPEYLKRTRRSPGTPQSR